MKIVIVCGAGASSTFLAIRMRRAARLRGLDIEVTPRSESMLDDALDGADLVLLGSHLAGRVDALSSRITPFARLAVLSEEMGASPNGDLALDFALSAAAQERTT